ncbi:MAG: hypothetical protein ABW007_17815 [Chitinophagaceae bacterium]
MRNTIVLHKVRTAVIAVLTLSLLSCNLNKKIELPPIESAALYVKWEMFSPDLNQLIKFEDTLYKYESNNEILYKSSIQHDNARKSSKDSNEFIIDNASKTSKQYIYLIHTKGEDSAWEYRPFRKKEPTRRHINQWLTRKISFNENMFSTTEDTLISILKQKNGEITETYTPKHKRDASYPDTSYYTFSSNYPSKLFVLSQAVLEKRLITLRKALFVYNSSDDPMIPRREMIFELLPIESIQKPDSITLRLLLKK